MLAKIFISSLILVVVLSQTSSCPGTACTGYCCPSTLQTCSSPAFANVCWSFCDASTTCGNGCCQPQDKCQKEKAGSFCTTKVYPLIGKTMKFAGVDWMYIEWYTIDDSNMTSIFAPMNNTSASISALSTPFAINYFTGYGSWGKNSTVTDPSNMQLQFTCHQMVEPCQLAYSIRSGIFGTASAEQK